MGNLTKKILNNATGVEIEFLISDWVLMAGQYILDLQHNLESEKVNTELYDDSDNKVGVSRTNILNTNTIRLYTTLDPDCRFNGKIIIISV